MVSYTSTESTLRHNKEKEEYTMRRRMYESKYPRREGEALWRYNRRISKKMHQDTVETIIGVVIAAILIAFMYVCLMCGGDDQCTFIKCNHDIDGYNKAYCCEQHGHDCMEND